MPNEFSNFTMPDVGNATDGRRGMPTGNVGSTDPTMVWDPSAFNPQTGTNSGAWVHTNQQTGGNAGSATPTFESGAWGGSGNMLDGQGNPIPGTSGAALDADRYRDMGQTPTNKTGPVLDQTASNQTRGISMDGLDLLGQTAAGTVPSAAERLGSKQAADAQAAQFSMGQSVRGGAVNRAAASRAAIMNSAQIAGAQRQANAATRAGEMAGARGAYLGAASGQRGLDLGVAATNAGLESGQRSLNDQHEGFYEGMAQDTKNAQLSHQLGRTAQDDAAANAARATTLAGDIASTERAQKNVDTAIGGIEGGISAYGKATASPEPTRPY